MGMAPPVLEDVVLVLAAGTVVDGPGTPEVKGLPPETVLAPLKAGGLLVADGMGMAVVFMGFSTLCFRVSIFASVVAEMIHTCQ
jgi:hypothetical protein